MVEVVLGDARDLKNYPEEPFHLTVTSPPYFVGKRYEEDYSYQDYLDLLKSVFSNVAKKTIDGGKIAINIADIAAFSKVSGRVEEGIEVSRFLVDWMRENDCYLLARYIWQKDDPWVNSQQVCYHDGVPATYIRALPNWEYIWVFYKGESPKRKDLPLLNEGKETEHIYSVVDQIDKNDWKKWVSAVWFMKSVRANDDHEAKFPEEFARRLVLMYSIKGDTVFDPFLGSGTTAVAASKVKRDFGGIERDPSYHKLATENINNALAMNRNESDYNYVRPPQFKQNRIF